VQRRINLPVSQLLVILAGSVWPPVPSTMLHPSGAVYPERLRKQQPKGMVPLPVSGRIKKCLYILRLAWQLWRVVGLGWQVAARRIMTECSSVIRAADLHSQPWANGGGLTRVIVDRPDFRLSLATIDTDGPFSHFPGTVRHFAVIAGQVILHPFAGHRDRASPVLVFSGSDAITAELIDGPVLALNLMVPRQAPPLRGGVGEGCPEQNRRSDGARAEHPHPTLPLQGEGSGQRGALRLERGTGQTVDDALAVFADTPTEIGGHVLQAHDTLIPNGAFCAPPGCWIVR
jgi:hypothetical protein